MDIHSQGLRVAACLIGCTVFSVVLCTKVLPDPADCLAPIEQPDLRRSSKLVLGWVVLATLSIVAGHLFAYYTLGSTPTCRAAAK
ncbi:hypothetical protein ACS7SF_10020 [Ralstonia sp. 25C]|uniref:hypothetical protein n=1 Tax=Ralstonia sp. 25C TaxID=3447363 RepID=UPI003F74DD54